MVRARLVRLSLLGFLFVELIRAPFALAWPPTYGAEFEFVHPSLRSREDKPGPEEQEFAKRFRAALEAKCGTRCTLSPHPGKWGEEYRVTFENGWWFNISWDPVCVEIQTKPSDLQTLRSERDTIDSYIFETARSLGFGPGTAGHFNFGANSAFDGDGKLFLKFFTDYANHPELALGLLGFDTANAPPLSILRKEQRLAFREIVEKSGRASNLGIQDVVSEINANVYTYTPKYGSSRHYQAIGLKHIARAADLTTDQPEELRAIREQRNASEFILLAELIEGRIRFLKDDLSPMIYLEKETSPDVVPQTAVSRFYVYVVEAGLSWKKFRRLLRPFYQSTEPDLFVRGKVRWGSDNFVQKIKEYSLDALTSPLIRKRFLDAFSDPNCLPSRGGSGMEVLHHLIEIHLNLKPNGVHLDALRSLVDEILSSEPWNAVDFSSDPVISKLKNEAKPGFFKRVWRSCRKLLGA